MVWPGKPQKTANVTVSRIARLNPAGRHGYECCSGLLFSGFGVVPGAQAGFKIPDPHGGSAHVNRSVNPGCLDADNALFQKVSRRTV